MLFHKASLLPKERGFLFSHYEWLRSFLSRLTSLISSLISSRVSSGVSPLSAIALISANAAFAFAVTSSSSCRAFCRLSFRMVSDVCAISLSLLTFYCRVSGGSFTLPSLGTVLDCLPSHGSSYLTLLFIN